MKQKIYLSAAIVLLGLFFLFTAIVMTVDMQPIGPNESNVGLASINNAFRNTLGTTESYNETWYNISELAGLIPLTIAGCFAILGICQAIKRKSLFKIDSHLFVLACFYVAVLAVYVAFELVEINFRPVLMDGILEASYPSSHTMLSIGICTTAIFELHELIKNKKAILIAADCLCVAIAAAIVIGRLLSGVHWTTDIIAGLLLSGALVSLYCFAIALAKEKIAKKANKETDND